MTTQAQRKEHERMCWLVDMVSLGKRIDNVDTTWVRRHASAFRAYMRTVDVIREQEMERIFGKDNP